jgi:hypothetical protein
VVIFPMAAIISLALKRGSLAAASRNFEYACGSNWCEGPASTTIGVAPGLVRTDAVWQNAQLTAMRDTPQIVFFENPIGVSRPGSQIIPSAP